MGTPLSYHSKCVNARGLSLFSYAKAEKRIVAVPHGKVGIPDIVVEIEVKILLFRGLAELEQPSAVGGDKRTVKAFDIHLAILYSLIDA